MTERLNDLIDGIPLIRTECNENKIIRMNRRRMKGKGDSKKAEKFEKSERIRTNGSGMSNEEGKII